MTIFTPANEREARFLSATKTVAPQGVKGVSWEPNTNVDLTDGFGYYTGSYSALYRTQPAVRTVVDFLARNIAQLVLKVYVRIANDDRLELDDHPLAVLLGHPNPSTSRFQFMRDTVADKAVYDRAYWWLDRPLYPQAVVRIPPPRIDRRIIGTTIAYYAPDGKPIPRNQLVVFSGYSPDGAWCNEDGVSPLETLRRSLQEEYASQVNRQSFWKNAGRQAGVIERPADADEWSDAARTRFGADWQNFTSGPNNAGRTPVLEDGMHYNPLAAFSPKDSEYIAGRELFFEEVARAYGVAPKLFGMGDIANANIDAFHRQLYQDTFGPWLKDLQDGVELQLLPATDVADAKTRAQTYTEFDIVDKLASSPEERMKALVTAAGAPILTRHEARAQINLPKLGNVEYDELITPMNVTVGGQPSQMVPLEVPQPKRRKTKAEAPAAVIRRRDSAAEEFTTLFRSHFRAQRQAAEKKATAPDTATWNEKLAATLFLARMGLAEKTGRQAARQIRGVYDPKMTTNYHYAAAQGQAEAVNRQSATALAAADDPSTAWDIFIDSRAAQLGISTATAIIGFARSEAARQSTAADGRERTKEWVVTSANSRHPELDGESVGLDDPFSNGLSFPGDPSGDDDQTAGCSCLLQLNLA